MSDDIASGALLTADDVRALVREREDAAEAYAKAGARLKTVDDKLAAIRLLFPAVAERMFGDLAPAAPTGSGASEKSKLSGRTYAQEPFTDAVVRLLADERGGRSSKWLRETLSSEPQWEERVRKNPTALTNALGRLREREHVIRVGDLYYHPIVYADIQSGKIAEERESNTSSPTFTSTMAQIVAGISQPFTASQAIEAAKANPAAAERLKENAAAVYSWLGRQVQRGELKKQGDAYSLPDADGALDSDAASAPIAGRAATLPFENHDRSHG